MIPERRDDRALLRGPRIGRGRKGLDALSQERGIGAADARIHPGGDSHAKGRRKCREDPLGASTGLGGDPITAWNSQERVHAFCDGDPAKAFRETMPVRWKERGPDRPSLAVSASVEAYGHTSVGRRSGSHTRGETVKGHGSAGWSGRRPEGRDGREETARTAHKTKSFSERVTEPRTC